MRDIDELIARIKATVDSHRLGTGEYARWLWQDRSGSRSLGVSEYGCADAANILYTLNDFIREPGERERWVSALQGLQNPATGMYSEPTHHPIHTTAHCIAALELFDARPAYPLTGLLRYSTVEGLYSLLEGLDWEGNPWPQSHQGAGIYVCMTLTDTVSPGWVQAYFSWLWEQADPETGMWRKGCAGTGKAPPFHHMAGTFHYLFNHEYARLPLRYPERLIDTCIDMYEGGKIGNSFGNSVGFLEIDWAYCLNRASRQSSYRFGGCRDSLRRFAADYIDYLYSINHKTDDSFNDLHMLFGAVCALAELQLALPGEISSSRPLRLVLDRRPFI